MTPTHRIPRAARPWIALAVMALGACTSAAERNRIVDPFDPSGPEPAVVVQPEYRIVPGDVLQVSFLVKAEELSEYRIQIHDEVEVKFVTLPEYDTAQVVRPDGRITLPFEGDVRIAGSTPAEATERIRRAYAGTLRVPDVFLAVKRPNAGLEALNQSVSTDDQDGRTVLVRPDGMISLPALGDLPAAGATVNELRERVNEIYQRTYAHANVDLILVESAGSVVSVLGEVQSPGAIPVTRPLMLFEALALAGGDTLDSELGTVVTMRRVGTTLEARVIDMDALLSGDSKAVMPLVQAGDIVYVPRTPLSTAAQVMRQISDITAFQSILQGATIAIINDSLQSK